MGCDNLATKDDIQRLQEAIINELNNKFQAISIQISQGFTQVTSQTSEILNEIRRLKQSIDDLSKQINVIIPIINNVLNVVIQLRAEINLILNAITNLSATINGTLNATLNAINSLKAEISAISSIVASLNAQINLVNQTVSSLKADIQSVNNNIQNTNNQINQLNSSIQNIDNRISQVSSTLNNISNVVSNISNVVSIVNSALPTLRLPVGGGGLVEVNLTPVLQLIIEIQNDINFIKVNCLEQSGGGSQLLDTEIELQEIECIDCEALAEINEPCSPEQLEEPYEITRKLVRGVPSALEELDNKLIDIIKKDCEKKSIIEKFVKVVVTKEPRASKVYYGETIQETVVFAGWVAFSKQVKTPNGGVITFKIGLEQPIRRMEQYFYVPEYADGYTVQPLHFAELEHELIMVENGTIVN
jgi:chromosome segregation ATPase